MARKTRTDLTRRTKRLVRPEETEGYDRGIAVMTLQALGLEFDAENVTDNGASFMASKDEYRAFHNTYPEMARRMSAA